MLTSDQERALERFSLECRGYSVQVRELKAGAAIFRGERKTVLVEADGTMMVLRGRRARATSVDQPRDDDGRWAGT